MEANEYQRLIEKLKRVETLFADRAATPGEQAAAGEARERIRQRLAAFALTDPPIEYNFAVRNPWSQKLFIALLRRYEIRPYRYARQRYKPEPNFSKTGVGSLSSASTEERAQEEARSTALIARLQGRAQKSGEKSNRKTSPSPKP